MRKVFLTAMVVMAALVVVSAASARSHHAAVTSNNPGDSQHNGCVNSDGKPAKCQAGGGTAVCVDGETVHVNGSENAVDKYLEHHEGATLGACQGDQGGGDEGGGDQGGSASAASDDAAPRDPNRYGFCSVPGNTWPDGTPIMPGTFLNLLLDQPADDAHYQGAVPSFYVEGEGLTCSLTPSQAALAATSNQKIGGGGDITPFGFYLFVPQS
jgi:hypothetical protein